VERTTLPFARILNLSIARAKGGESDVVDRSPLSNAEIESVLEIALTMATANGDTSPEELDSLADLVAHLRGKRPKPGELGTIMTTIQARDVSASVEERVKIIAKTLHRSVARELAYKAAYAIRVADLESNPDEEELGEILVEALGLEDLAADLENEVNEALIAE
jgi:tellurite resistance protein